MANLNGGAAWWGLSFGVGARTWPCSHAALRGVGLPILSDLVVVECTSCIAGDHDAVVPPQRDRQLGQVHVLIADLVDLAHQGRVVSSVLVAKVSRKQEPYIAVVRLAPFAKCLSKLTRGTFVK